MRPTARAMFRSYSEELEGRTRSPYVDVKGFVTVSIGCIIDPISLALDLPWVIGDRPATHAEIRDDWQAVKALKERGEDLREWTDHRQAPLTSIRLTDEGVDALLVSRLEGNIAYLRKHYFAGWDEFPADAQLGIMSAAWALGAGFDKLKPPRLELIENCKSGDWLAAEVRARLREAGNAGVIKRNRQQKLLFENAQTVKERGLDPSWLWWPRACPRESSLQEEAVKAIGLVHDASASDSKEPKA